MDVDGKVKSASLAPRNETMVETIDCLLFAGFQVSWVKDFVHPQ